MHHNDWIYKDFGHAYRHFEGFKTFGLFADEALYNALRDPVASDGYGDFWKVQLLEHQSRSGQAAARSIRFAEKQFSITAYRHRSDTFFSTPMYRARRP